MKRFLVSYLKVEREYVDAEDVKEVEAMTKPPTKENPRMWRNGSQLVRIDEVK